MAKYHKPRSGSTGYSPRVKAKKQTPSIRSFPSGGEGALGFLCYKAGMTHVLAKDLDKHSPTHDMDVQIPVTVLDCPPLTIFGYRIYIDGYDGLEALTDILADKLDKDLARATQAPKEVKNTDKEKKAEESKDAIAKVALLAHTQPRKSGVGKRTPEVMELAIGGEPQEQLAYAKGMLGKEMSVKDVFNESEFVDAIAVTKGKGFQGPIKRWGIKRQKRKAKRAGHERHVGSIGGWKPANLSWLTPMAGQTGYHNRTDVNKLVLKIGEKGEEVNPAGGFLGYGLVKGEYVLLKGSVPGPRKRAIALRKAVRASEKPPTLAIDYVSTVSQQGS